MTHRDDRILEMREAGMSYREIAARLKMPYGTVWDAVSRTKTGSSRRASPLVAARHRAHLRSLVEQGVERSAVDEAIHAARIDHVIWADIADAVGLSESTLASRYSAQRKQRV